MPAFISSFLTQPQYNVLFDEVDITVSEIEVEDGDRGGISDSSSRRLRSTRGLDGGDDKHTHIEEEVEIEETVIIQERSAKPWRTLLTGLPSPTSALLSLLTLLANVALVLMVTDFVYRGKVEFPSSDLSFARVGHVSDTEAKLLLREPDENQWPIFVQLKIKDPKPPFDFVGWQPVGGVNYFTNDTDFTAVLSMPIRAGKATDYEWVRNVFH